MSVDMTAMDRLFQFAIVTVTAVFWSSLAFAAVGSACLWVRDRWRT